MSGHQRTKESFLNIHYGNLKDIHVLMSFFIYLKHCIDRFPSYILSDLHSDPMQWQLLSSILTNKEIAALPNSVPYQTSHSTDGIQTQVILSQMLSITCYWCCFGCTMII